MENVLAALALDGRRKIVVSHTVEEGPALDKARKHDLEQVYLNFLQITPRRPMTTHLYFLKLLENAKNGCLPSCEAAIRALTFDELPESIYPKILEILTTHITNSCPPDKADEHQLRLAETSFAAICGALVFCLPHFEQPPLEPILQAWPSILTWANVYYIRNSFPYERRLRATPGRIIGEEELTMLFMGIYRLTATSDEFMRIAFDPIAIELAMYVFLRARAECSRISCIPYLAIYLLGRDNRPRPLDVILSVAQGTPEAFLDPILEQIARGYIPGVTPACAGIMISIASVRGHPLSLALNARGADSVYKLFETIANNKDRYISIIADFRECIRVFSLYWEPQDGRVWLLRALQTRYFHFIAQYDELKRAPFIQDLLTLHLPVHLADPSVIFTCEEALSSLPSQEHSRIMSSDLKSAWMTFINRFFEQYLFYCYFEVAGYRKGCYKCSKVPDNKKPGSLLFCGGCRAVGYCSKECQTSGWKDHKTECKTLKGKKYGPLPKWAAPMFRRRLAAHDARRHFIGFRELAEQKCPTLPFQCVCVIIDYSTYPPQLNVCPANEIKVKHTSSEEVDSNTSIQEECFDNFRLHDGSCGSLLTREYIDGAHTTHSQYFHWTPPYFCSPFGTRCPDSHKRKSLVTPYLAVNDKTSNKKEKEQKTAWSVVDELAFRTGLTPQMILEGKTGEFRKKVLEVVVREKATMRERSKIN
ncbi:hypothetical protein ACEPAI_6445 [Sanghuangporus weigelae]